MESCEHFLYYLTFVHVTKRGLSTDHLPTYSRLRSYLMPPEVFPAANVWPWGPKMVMLHHNSAQLWTAYYFYIRRASHTLICLPYLLEEFCLEFSQPKAFFFKLMNGKSCERKMHLLNDEGVIEITCQFRVWR